MSVGRDRLGYGSVGLHHRHAIPPPYARTTAALPVEPSNTPEAKVGAKTDEYGLPVAPLHN